MASDDNRGNCFDIIRHIAALMVLYSHQFALTGYREPEIPEWDTLGFLAVAIFFSISGYFMPGSFIRSGNFMDFIKRRLRRLLPGLVVCTFITNYLIAPIFVTEPAIEYIASYDTFLTFLSTAVFLGKDIPGAFGGWIFPHAINGSLWTLPIEFMCYLIIGAALSFSKNFRVPLGLFLLSVVGTVAQVATGYNYSFYNVPLSYLLMFGICFNGGALLSMTRPAWEPHRAILVAAAAVGILITRGRPEINVVGPLALTLLTIMIGTAYSEKLIRGRFDISYGIYIYAFPIQQIVINVATQNLWLSMMLSLALTLMAAYLSYRFVESPFLPKRLIDKNTLQRVDNVMPSV
ncbi:MAG: acyltransferase [Cutibacterium sp.]|nr:acyltransferase [Cutibacterium sp.]